MKIAICAMLVAWSPIRSRYLAMKVIRSVHPYEEPLVNVLPLAKHLFEMKSMSGQ